MYARGAIVGLTRGTGRAHLARAALEAIAYQTRDVIEAMAADTGQALARLRVDGGAAANDFLMQFQSDTLGVPVERPYCTDTTGLGAAYLAGLAVGYWDGPEDILRNWERDRLFQPELPQEGRAAGYAGWKRAVERAKDWVRD
jgi:glycerol kinase